jgi:hypothetical protein
MVYMEPLKGKTSDRIRTGEIPEEAISNKRIDTGDAPKMDSIKNSSGKGLGNGATRKRSGRGAQT